MSKGEFIDSELNESLSTTRRKLAIGLGAAVTAGLVFAGLAVGVPKLIPDSEPQPKIVGGVPAQVEARTVIKKCSTKLPSGVCLSYSNEYSLTLEQCKMDVQNAQKGEAVTPSFDSRLGHIAADCYTARLSVGHEAYDRYRPGMIITPVVS